MGRKKSGLLVEILKDLEGTPIGVVGPSISAAKIEASLLRKKTPKITPEEAAALYKHLLHASLPNDNYIVILNAIKKLGVIGGVTK